MSYHLFFFNNTIIVQVRYIIIETKEVARIGYNGLHLSTHAEKETRYIQYGPLLLFQQYTLYLIHNLHLNCIIWYCCKGVIVIPEAICLLKFVFVDIKSSLALPLKFPRSPSTCPFKDIIRIQFNIDTCAHTLFSPRGCNL